MSSKANEAWRGKPPVTHVRDPLFSFAKTPVPCDPPPTSNGTAGRRPVLRKVREQDTDPLMVLPPQPTPTPRPAPKERPLPAWIRNHHRWPLQVVLYYMNSVGQHESLHIDQRRNIDAQDVETKKAIDAVLNSGGTDLVLQIFVVKAGTTIARWTVEPGEQSDDAMDFRLVGVSSAHMQKLGAV